MSHDPLTDCTCFKALLETVVDKAKIVMSKSNFYALESTLISMKVNS